MSRGVLTPNASSSLAGCPGARGCADEGVRGHVGMSRRTRQVQRYVRRPRVDLAGPLTAAGPGLAGCPGCRRTCPPRRTRAHPPGAPLRPGPPPRRTAARGAVEEHRRGVRRRAPSERREPGRRRGGGHARSSDVDAVARAEPDPGPAIERQVVARRPREPVAGRGPTGRGDGRARRRARPPECGGYGRERPSAARPPRRGGQECGIPPSPGHEQEGCWAPNARVQVRRRGIGDRNAEGARAPPSPATLR